MGWFSVLKKITDINTMKAKRGAKTSWEKKGFQAVTANCLQLNFNLVLVLLPAPVAKTYTLNIIRDVQSCVFVLEPSNICVWAV